MAVNRPGAVADPMTRWDRWQVTCGWLALAAAACWATKFLLWALLASRYTGGQVDNRLAAPAVLMLLVGLVLPTAGSVSGLLAGSGLAVPWVRARAWYVALPVAVAVGVLFTVLASAAINASARLFSGSTRQVWQVEGTDVVAAVVLATLGLALLPGRPTRSGHR